MAYYVLYLTGEKFRYLGDIFVTSPTKISNSSLFPRNQKKLWGEKLCRVMKYRGIFLTGKILSPHQIFHHFPAQTFFFRQGTQYRTVNVKKKICLISNEKLRRIKKKNAFVNFSEKFSTYVLFSSCAPIGISASQSV